MSDNVVPIRRDGAKEYPVPTVWRPTIMQVAAAFADGDFALSAGILNVDRIESSDSKRFKANVEAYGGVLDLLCEETWKHSVSLWMNGYWDVLVDLCTKEERPSDLALFLKVKEEYEGFRFSICSVHVP